MAGRWNHIPVDSSTVGLTQDQLICLAALREHRHNISALYRTMGETLLQSYYQDFVEKQPCYNSQRTGHLWISELLQGSGVRFKREFRMDPEIFQKLIGDLSTKYGLHVSERARITLEESVCMFLSVMCQGSNIRHVCELFQHSSRTISAHFHRVLKAMAHMAADMCQPRYSQSYKHPILDNPKYKHFQNCIGAIDGTHVMIKPPPTEALPYFGRKGCYTVNIFAACDFDMCFTFVSPGWEGSMHDSRVFKNIIHNPDFKFPHPQSGKYLLADAGYPNVRGYLTPYKGSRYHQEEFEKYGGPSNDNEHFNKFHSSLRSIIERTFGVWKRRFGILSDMREYDLDTQIRLIGISMGLHNYIRRNQVRPEDDPDLLEVEDNPEFVMNDLPDLNDNPLEGQEDQYGEHEEMTILRNSIRDKIVSSRTRRRRGN